LQCNTMLLIANTIQNGTYLDIPPEQKSPRHGAVTLVFVHLPSAIL
jgi:hypothetical protein